MKLLRCHAISREGCNEGSVKYVWSSLVLSIRLN